MGKQLSLMTEDASCYGICFVLSHSKKERRSFFVFLDRFESSKQTNHVVCSSLAIKGLCYH